jgi:hypothetical protein
VLRNKVHMFYTPLTENPRLYSTDPAAGSAWGGVTSLTVSRKTPHAGKYEGYFDFEQIQLYLHVALSIHRSPQCTVGTLKYLELSRTYKLHSHRRHLSSSVETLLLKHYGDRVLQRLG